MEYAECLDAAASEPDALKRIAYVAAFAMSNYSSTYGRIAKVRPCPPIDCSVSYGEQSDAYRARSLQPFNPMLGETFEYARPDKGFRYVSCVDSFPFLFSPGRIRI